MARGDAAPTPREQLRGIDNKLSTLQNARSVLACLTARADALFELAEAVLCTDGPVRSLVGLSLAPEHRRGHGALYDAVNCRDRRTAWRLAADGHRLAKRYAGKGSPDGWPTSTGEAARRPCPVHGVPRS